MKIDLSNFINSHSPGYVIEIFKNNNINEYLFGNSMTTPETKKVTENTLYDLASITKVFTATCIYIAFEENKLKLDDTIYKLNNNFTNLQHVTILDLLAHRHDIWTDGYLGDTTSKDSFNDILYSAYIKNDFPTYVDVHYMILSNVLEKIYNKDFKDILKEKIFDKLNLKNITFNPDPNRTASNNYEHQNDNIIDYIYPGIIHDTKARSAKKYGITTGHASLFSNGHDLIIFLKSFLDYSLLKKETIDMMLKHDDINLFNLNLLKETVSEDDVNKMYSKVKAKNKDFKLAKTYNYMGTRYKNNILKENDVPLCLSNNSIAFSGYTGPMFIIDFDKKIIVLILCNVIHNSKMNRIERKKTTDNIINEVLKQID